MAKIKIFKKTPTVKYSGSTIQQNFRESLDHGLLVWDLEKRNAEFIKIKNDVAFVTIHVNGGIVTTDRSILDTLPKNIKLRIKHSGTSPIQIQKIIDVFKKKYNVIESIPINNDLTILNSGNKITTLGDVYDVEYQNSLFKDYFVNNQVVNLEDIRRINTMCNMKLSEDRLLVRNTQFKLLDCEFNNMFSYGKDNRIDFTKLNGLVGIFAANASGKSSILDIITFCLFDKTSRTSYAKNIINNRSSMFSCATRFELNDVRYEIQRVGKLKNDGNVKVDVKFTKFVDGEYVNLSGKDRDETNANIRKYIGTYDDFLLTTLSTQNDPKSFIFKAQRERKNLLNSFLNLTVFSNLYEIANSEYKIKQGVVNRIHDELDKYDINLTQSQLESVNSDHKKLTHLLTEIESLQSSLVIDKTAIQMEISTIDFKYNIDDITNTIENCTTRNLQIAEDLVTSKLELKETKKKNNELTKKLNKSDYSCIAELKSTSHDIMHKLSDTRVMQKSDVVILKSIDDQLKHFEHYEYDENCQYCINNPLVLAAKENEKLRPGLIERINEYLGVIETLESDLHIANEKYEQLVSEQTLLLTEKDQCEKSIYLLENINIPKLQNEMSVNKERLKHSKYLKLQYNKKQNQLDRNQQLGVVLLEINKNIKTNTELQNKSITKLIELNNNINKLESTISAFDALKTELGSILNEIYVYQHYLQATHVNGVPQMILGKLLPLVEYDVNELLSHVVDFRISLTADEQDVKCSIVYPDGTHAPVEMSSGMERFIISIATRVSLTEMTTLPKLNFIAIDEGFGALDSTVTESLTLLFEVLKQRFTFIIIVSHLDILRDVVNSSMAIDKTADGFSHINI